MCQTGAMERCHECWNLQRFCSCALDRLEADLPTRCAVCGWAYELCVCGAQERRAQAVLAAQIPVLARGYFDGAISMEPEDRSCLHGPYFMNEYHELYCAVCGTGPIDPDYLV